MNPLSNDEINETAKKIFNESTFLSNVNQDFFQRIYSTPFEKYSQRLSSIGFSKMDKWQVERKKRINLENLVKFENKVRDLFN